MLKGKKKKYNLKRQYISEIDSFMTLILELTNMGFKIIMIEMLRFLMKK